MTDEIWACAACRSINKAKAKRCYKCRTPRDVARVDPATMPIGADQALPALALPAFRSTRRLALAASIFVLAYAGLQVLSLANLGRLLEGLVAGREPTQADVDSIVNLGILSVVIPLMALVVWAWWLSRVVTVMPALDLGYPHSTGLTSFVECLIPVFNFFRVPAILRDVTRRVAPGDGRGNALIAAAWIGLIGGFLIGLVGGFVLRLTATNREQLLRDLLALSGLEVGMTIVGLGFGVYLTWWIEAKIGQRHAQLESIGAPAEPPAPPALPPEPAPPPPVAEPFLPMASVPATPAAMDGPHLRVRVSGDTIEASLGDDEWEEISLSELGQAAVAIRNAGGSATLLASEDVLARGLGRDAHDEIKRSGAVYLVAPS